MLFSPKLKMWYAEALAEKGIIFKGEIDKRYAIFPKRFYGAVKEIGWRKSFDYCFIGALKIDDEPFRRRSWVLRFIEEKFGPNSYLQFTDRKTRENYRELGEFDFALKKNGLVPKEVPIARRNQFDENYFHVMCSSSFALCPGGDQNWSIRFYEALMCKSIPILLDHSPFRTAYEKQLPYKYFLTTDEIKYNEEWADINYELFLRYHTLEYR